ncbi:hypothetical protein AAFC00_007013 [Neodothiora populina]|uniref:Xylanolytic transcriptional activator regulatory domain-containing protein n=1 Tax=Neodothiora populina TaxID=2781224 RepID=A0ABR3PBX4_9PEZI
MVNSIPVNHVGRANYDAITESQSVVDVPDAVEAINVSTIPRLLLSTRQNTSRIGFLGPSSYSAVYTENAPTIDIDVHDGSDQSPTPTAPPISIEKIKAGAEVLSLISDVDAYDRLLTRWYGIADGLTIPRPIYNIHIRGIRALFEASVSEHNSDEELYCLSELLWQNTLNSIPVDANTTGPAWARSTTGNYLRWETVGLIFSGVGLLSSGLTEWDPVFTTIKSIFKDRKTLMWKTRDAVEACVAFCKECECSNELFVIFLYESAILSECVRGDTYYGAWTRLGEACDALIVMGLHQDKKVNSTTSFFISQLRTRIFADIYVHDKLMATFLGRPPRLSHRYCVLQLPLDLSDDEIMLEGPKLESAISGLKDDWNTVNRFSRVTRRRIWIPQARIREKILEFTLGPGDSMTTEVASQILIDLENLKDGTKVFIDASPEEVLADILPSGHLKSSTRIPSEMRDRPYLQHEILCFLAMHCDLIHTEFLLQRALVKRNKAPHQSLIAPARALLSFLLQIFAKREYCRDFLVDITLLLPFYGLASAGVLAIELLKQERQTRKYHVPPPPDYILHRSETIQDLSVFVATIATVGPGESNYAICDQGRRALKCLLDKILTPEPMVNTASVPIAATADASVATTMDCTQMDLTADRGAMAMDLDISAMADFYFPNATDAEFLHWLEDVDWDRGSCLHSI